MTLHLALPFINIIPALWCSGGWRHRGLFVMQQEKIKDLGNRKLLRHGNMSETEGCVTRKGVFSALHVCSVVLVHSGRALWAFVSPLPVPRRPPLWPRGHGLPRNEIILQQRCQKEMRPSSTPLCHPKHSTYSSVWAMPLCNTCSPM